MKTKQIPATTTQYECEGEGCDKVSTKKKVIEKCEDDHRKDKLYRECPHNCGYEILPSSSSFIVSIRVFCNHCTFDIYFNLSELGQEDMGEICTIARMAKESKK